MSEILASCGRGAIVVDGGVNFTLYSERARAVELCLFDDRGVESSRLRLESAADGLWHRFVAGVAAGQRYGYRVHGSRDAERGLRFNPSKLLIDPYAVRLDGDIVWGDALLDSNDLDSAACMPKCVVEIPGELPTLRTRPAWSELIIYEANVRGYTMCHPGIPEADRGRFAGLSNGVIIEYLKALGITSIELMPVQSFMDEAFLQQRGLRNLWGYNSFNFFAPAARLANGDAPREFRQMVRDIHDAGIEVILDVAYNHTAETDTNGPTLSFRGIDNLTYYRTPPGKPGEYINDTGCGNTLNTSHAEVRKLIVDSLAYWVSAFGVDGFRFDLAATLGRGEHGFDARHPIFEEIRKHPRLRDTRLIAEPWDIGPGGYQLGHFPKEWAEWNDVYRDDVRRFWRGDPVADHFARRLHGSADVFEGAGKLPFASTNLICTHDGFTLADVVSYEHRHNEANGEHSNDGHKENFSCNHGVEGPSADAAVIEIRRRQRLNMLATLLMSQGTPLLLAGDEFGNSQAGNNNAYAQDNEIGWLDWHGLEDDPDFTRQVRALIDLRRDVELFRQPEYRHRPDAILWYSAEGDRLADDHWSDLRAFMLRLKNSRSEALVLFNGSTEETVFEPPPVHAGEWAVRFDSAGRAADADRQMTLAAFSLRACVSHPY